MHPPERRLQQFVGAIGRAEALDAPIGAVRAVTGRIFESDQVKGVLSGAPLGHRLHPLLTDIPIGCWTSASMLDLVAWRSGRAGARRLVALGVVAALPTVASGLSDWTDTETEDRRIGFVHAGGNSIGILLEVASWSARRRGHHVRGAVLGASALGVMTAAGYLGGHLVFARRVGPTVETPLIADPGWHSVCRGDDLVDDQPFGTDVEGVTVVVVRRGAEVYALAARCNHAGGPLDRGSVQNGAIACPWHGSRFCLRDGRVVRGPASTPQPTYETRIRAGVVEIRRHPVREDETAPAPALRGQVKVRA
jgi:nitrite reductase/ring-hydroxylating ferredoxin subunit/uncharacterized membrane protein